MTDKEKALDIELPPLPEPEHTQWVDGVPAIALGEHEEIAMKYAKAAVEADRKHREESAVCFKCGHAKHSGECVNVAPQPADKVRDLEKDAARYRWLREAESDDVAVVSGLGAMDYGMSAVVYTYSEEIGGEALDKAIDKAMKGK